MITLRDYKEKDLNTLYLIRNDNNIQNLLMSFPKKESFEDVKNWLANKQIKDLFKIIALNENDLCIGYLQLVNIDKNRRSGKLGITIYKDYQNLGYGQKALTLFFDILKKEFNFEKVYLEVLMINKNAIKVYEKLGFYQINKLKNNFLLDSKNLDVIKMEKVLND